MNACHVQVSVFEMDMAEHKLTGKWLLMESKRLIRAELKSQGLAAEPQVSVEAQVTRPMGLDCLSNLKLSRQENVVMPCLNVSKHLS